MSNTPQEKTALNGGAKALLLNLLGIKQIKEMLERGGIKVEGFNISKEASHQIYYEIFEAFRSEEDKDKLLEHVGLMIAEREKMKKHIMKLNAELDLPQDYPMEKLEGGHTLKKLYRQGKISKLFYMRFRSIAPTVHHLAEWSVERLKRSRKQDKMDRLGGCGPKLIEEFIQLKKEFNI